MVRTPGGAATGRAATAARRSWRAMAVASSPLSIEALQARLAALSRVALGAWPTPLEGCPRLSASWAGPPIVVKRDDLSGLALGGNKVRHLEFRIANALARGCDSI